MSKLVLHLFHDDAPSRSTVPALAERMHQAPGGSAAALEVYISGPVEGALAKLGQSDQKAFNAQIDGLVKQGVRVTTCIGLAQKFGAEAAFRARGTRVPPLRCRGCNSDQFLIPAIDKIFT